MADRGAALGQLAASGDDLGGAEHRLQAIGVIAGALDEIAALRRALGIDRTGGGDRGLANVIKSAHRLGPAVPKGSGVPSAGGEIGGDQPVALSRIDRLEGLQEQAEVVVKAVETGVIDVDEDGLRGVAVAADEDVVRRGVDVAEPGGRVPGKTFEGGVERRDIETELGPDAREPVELATEAVAQEVSVARGLELVERRARPIAALTVKRGQGSPDGASGVGIGEAVGEGGAVNPFHPDDESAAEKASRQARIEKEKPGRREIGARAEIEELQAATQSDETSTELDDGGGATGGANEIDGAVTSGGRLEFERSVGKIPAEPPLQ